MEKLSKILEKIQLTSEDVHCASVIQATEALLRDSYHDKCNKRINDIKDDLVAAIKKDDKRSCEKLIEEMDSIKQKLDNHDRIKIVVDYEDVDENSARHIIKDDIIIILLPEYHRNIIKDNINLDTNVWSDKMRESKEKLRNLTLHEVVHIIFNFVYTISTTEKEVDEFVEKLCTVRKARNDQLYRSDR